MSKDIKALMAIYTILILTGWLIGLNYQLNKEIDNKIEAMSIALELNKSNDEYIAMLESMNKYADELESELYQYQNNRLIKDLLSIDKNLQVLVLALCYTESNLNYEVKHKGKFDKSTKGICGIKSVYWIDEIKELNHTNINSLYAGSLVIEHLLNKYDGDLEKALIHFKGAKKNLTGVYKVINLYKELR